MACIKPRGQQVAYPTLAISYERSLPIKHEPNSSMDLYDGEGLKQRRYYDGEGRALGWDWNIKNGNPGIDL